MRGLVIAGLLVASFAVAALPGAPAQGVVNSRFDAVLFEPFAGDPLPAGQGSFANLKFSWCFDQGSAATPQDNGMKATFTVNVKPDWAEVSLNPADYTFTLGPTDGASADAAQRCKPVPNLQVQVQIADDAPEGETSDIEVLISGEAVGNVNAPESVTAIQSVGVAVQEEDLISELNNASGEETDPLPEASDNKDSPAPGGLLVMAAAGTAVALAAFGRRRRA